MEVLSVHVPVSNGHILHRGILFRSPFKTFSAHWNTIHFLVGSERSRSRSHCHVPWKRLAAGALDTSNLGQWGVCLSMIAPIIAKSARLQLFFQSHHFYDESK